MFGVRSVTPKTESRDGFHAVLDWVEPVPTSSSSEVVARRAGGFMGRRQGSNPCTPADLQAAASGDAVRSVAPAQAFDDPGLGPNPPQISNSKSPNPKQIQMAKFQCRKRHQDSRLLLAGLELLPFEFGICFVLLISNFGLACTSQCAVERHTASVGGQTHPAITASAGSNRSGGLQQWGRRSLRCNGLLEGRLASAQAVT